MPTQLQLEGPDLETLLSRVKVEHGPGARIVRAEKVRTGGIAGFFAKERFEICVELDQPPGILSPGNRAPAQLAPLLDMPLPASLLDLADQVSAVELSAHTRGVDARPGSAHPTNDRPTAQRRSSDRPVDDPNGFRAWPEPRTGAAPVAAGAAPVSTEGTGFAAVLARLGMAAGPSEEPLPTATAAMTPASMTNAPATTDRLETTDASDVPVTPHPALPRQRAAADPGSAVGLADTGRLSLPRTSEIAVRGVERAPAVSGISGICGQLVELGLPAHLLPAPAAGPVYPALVQSLRQLPMPRATNRAGGVLVVVGPQALALEVAREIARDLELPVATAVVLATARRGRAELPAKQVVRSPAAAVERRALWRRRRNLTVVAVDAPLTAAGAANARAFLAALQPSATWGVVEATRKAHDVGRWARALGGVDALALTAVEETADPAAVLTLGIPVGRLGATKATPAAWAALLTDRMAA